MLTAKLQVACLWLPEGSPTQKLAEICLRFSPQICVREGRAVFIEIGKCGKLYSEAGFHVRMLVILRRLNLQARIGFGRDITEALLRAQFNENNTDLLPLSALLELADPFNRDEVLRKYVQKMVTAFTDLGVPDLGRFKLIPASDLIPRFGPVAVLCRQRVNFEVPVTWTYWKPEEVVRERTDFPYFEFYGELEPILFELKKQLDVIFQRLWARGQKAQSLSVKIFCETTSASPEPFRQFNFDFLFPQSASKGTLKILKERLSRDFEKKPVLTPLEGLETTVTAAVAGKSAQKNLLHNFEEINEQKEALLAQLAEIHGQENIFQAFLVEDRRPEKSWSKKPPKKTPAPGLAQKIPPRPTHLLRPERVQIEAGFVLVRGQKYRILEWSKAVERISGAWHGDPRDLNPAYDRDYYKLELDSGGAIAVFQTPDQNYFLHGYFG